MPGTTRSVQIEAWIRVISQYVICVSFVHFCAFELCLWKNKEEEQNRNVQNLVFPNLLKVSGTFGVDIALE